MATLQVTDVNWQSAFRTDNFIVLCDSARNHSWFSENWATKLNVQGTPFKLIIQGNNPKQTIHTQIVELKLETVHSGGTCPFFVVKPYVRKDINLGSEIIDVELLQVQYPHLAQILLKNYSYGDVKMSLGQDMLHSIIPLEHFETQRMNTPIVVRLLLGWALSGPLSSTILDMLHGWYSKRNRFKAK